MHRAFLSLALLLTAATLRAEPVLQVATSIPPHKYLIERIGGDRVTARAMVLPGQNPHTFEPTPKQVGELARCSLFFSTGMPFEEQLLERLKGIDPGLKVLDLQEGVAMRKFTQDELDAHEAEEKAAGVHEEEGPGHDESVDPHTWMSPRIAKQQAETIMKGLAAADPEGAAGYKERYGLLTADLEALDLELAQTLTPLKGKDLLVYHPAFGYFADAYGLRQSAVETGGREPNARQLRDLIKRAKAAGARVIFVQPQFSKVSAQTVAAQIGGTVVSLDDLAENYPANLRQIAQSVRANISE